MRILYTGNTKTASLGFFGTPLAYCLLCILFFFFGGSMGNYIDELLRDPYPDILPPFGPLPRQIRRQNTPNTENN